MLVLLLVSEHHPVPQAADHHPDGGHMTGLPPNTTVFRGAVHLLQCDPFRTIKNTEIATDHVVAPLLNTLPFPQTRNHPGCPTCDLSL